MSRARLVWALCLYVALIAGHALVLRHLARAGVSAEDTMIFRGIACIACAAVAGLVLRQSLVPNKPGLQLARFFFSGFALWLITAAYQHANATTVTVISRLDTAILMVLGPMIGVAATGLQRGLSLVAIFMLVGVAIWGGSGTGDTLLGYGLAFVGTAGITAGYLFLRSSGKSENDQVVAAVAGLAIAFYGVAGRALGVGHPSTLDASSLAWLGVAGIAMYLIYILTLKLYKLMDITLAEYPTLFAALLVMPAEAVLFQVSFEPMYIAAMVANVALLGGILALGYFKPAVVVAEASSSTPV